MATRAEQVIKEILECDTQLSMSSQANTLAYLIRDEQDRKGPVTDLANKSEIELCEKMISLIYARDNLRERDGYVSCLTAIQFCALNDTAVNMAILRHTPKLLPIAMDGYEKDPNGYTGPELFSLWGALVSDLGRGTCEKYMTELPKTLFPVMNSNTVGSIVVALLLANLVGHREDQVDVFETAIPMIKEALQAAFSGGMYGERQWGPSKPCQALGVISTSDANKKQILDLNILPMIHDVLKKKDMDWPIQGFDPKYYMLARSGAAKLIWNMAFFCDIPKLLPGIDETLKDIIQMDGLLDETKSNVMGCLFKLQQSRNSVAQIEETGTIRKKKKKTKKGKEAESESSAAEGGHIMLSYNWGVQPFVVWLKQYLTDHGFQVWLDIDQMNASTLEAMALAVEQAKAVIVCITPEYKESESCRTEGEYAYQLRKNIVPVKVDSTYKPDGWLGAMMGSKLWVAFDDSSAYERSGLELLRNLERQGIVPGANQKGGKGGKQNDELLAAKERARTAEAKVVELEKKLREARMQANNSNSNQSSDDSDIGGDKFDQIMSAISDLADNVADLRKSMIDIERKVDQVGKRK